MDRIDQAIEQANQGLHRVKIFRRDRKLALRGSLPKKHGEGRGNKQRTIALGMFANLEGVKVALARAQRLESDLSMERFDWADWEGGGDEKKTRLLLIGLRSLEPLRPELLATAPTSRITKKP